MPPPFRYQGPTPGEHAFALEHGWFEEAWREASGLGSALLRRLLIFRSGADWLDMAGFTRLRHRIDMLRITAVHPPENGDAPQLDTQVFTDLSTAIHAREELRFDYPQDRNAANGQQRRRVQPHHLVTWRGRWYLLAWDLDRDDWRTFRVDRIHPRTPTGPRFTPRELPGGDVPAFITSRFRGSGGTTTDWPCQGEVVLDLPAAAVVPFTQDGIVEELGPDRCRLALGSWSWTGLAATIGRFDADVEVIGPPELNDAFAHLATHYANAARTTTPS
ncbi:WYL domain-containing protein [Streptomyces nigrescens]|uniref:helix-turn-helix transcriptional regulator n=1 Tax=Streptomyces nigrescens TaxID=1920 RepID=UPI003473EA08